MNQEKEIMQILSQNLLITVMKFIDGEKQSPLWERDDQWTTKDIGRSPTNDNITQEKIVDVIKKLQEVYKDEEQ